MRNRAKCKLCKKEIESLHPTDYQPCECGEIAIDGGENNFKCYAKNWDNFLRIDEDGKEIPITVVESPIQSDNESASEKIVYLPPTPPSKSEMINMLDEMINYYDNLPDHEKHKPASQYDLMSLMILIRSIFKAN